jgi:hypothetical protein
MLIVADGAPGLTKAIEQCWPASDRQRCCVHRARNLYAKLPDRERERVKHAYWQALDERSDPSLSTSRTTPKDSPPRQILLNTTPVPAAGGGGGSGGGGSGGGGTGGVGAIGGKPGLPGNPKALPSLLGGLASLGSAAAVTNAGVVAIGTASNPPIASTTQSLTYGLAGAARAGRHGKQAVVVANGSTNIPSGTRRTVTLKLTSAGRTLLRRYKRLRTILKLTARGTDGRSASEALSVTLKVAQPVKRRRPR